LVCLSTDTAFNPYKSNKPTSQKITGEINDQERIMARQLAEDAEKFTRIWFMKLAEKYGMEADVQFIEG
jgi:hypothetical protein